MKNEVEILKKLGLSNLGELEKILGFKVQYNAEYTVFEVLSDSPVERLVGSKSQGWRAKLEGNTKKISNKNLKLNLELPNKNPIKVNGQNFFHRGHILAKEFYCFINDKRKDCLIRHNNSKNGFIQFSVANMQQTKVKNDIFRQSQAFYENEICNYLNDNKGKILYEVKIFFYNKTDKIPIGTKILFKTLEMNNSKEQLEARLLNHVFIPNLDSDFDLSKSPNYLDEKTYREFYCKGYDERYNDCFTKVAEIVIDNNLTKTYDTDGNQIFYFVSKNKQDIEENVESGIFLNVEDATRTFSLDIEEMSVEYFIEQELKDKKGKYYPARNEKSCISAVFYNWNAVEKLPGFAMRGLEKQSSLIEAFQKLNWIDNQS